MAWMIDEAPNDDLVHVVSRDDAKGIYIIRVGALQTAVKIALRRTRGRPGATAYTQSHAIKTPQQAGPYWTSRPSNDSPGAALHQAVEGLVFYYRKAVEAGHIPSEEWLVLG
jgi:hypothetical protein